MMYIRLRQFRHATTPSPELRLPTRTRVKLGAIIGMRIIFFFPERDHGCLLVFTTSKLEKNADAVSTYVSKEIDWKIIGHCVPQAQLLIFSVILPQLTKQIPALRRRRSPDGAITAKDQFPEFRLIISQANYDFVLSISKRPFHMGWRQPTMIHSS